MTEKTNQSKKIIIRLIYQYILPHKLNIFFALLMMIISAAATGLHAWLVRPALDEVLIKGNKEMLFLIPIAIIIVTLCKGIATYTHSFQMSKIAHKIISKLQSEMFEKLMYFNIKFYNDSKSGNLISRLINDTYFLRMAIVKTVTGVIKDVLVIIFLLGNMLYQSWELTIFAFFAFPLALWPIKKIGNSIRKVTNTIQSKIAIFSNMLAESVKGIRQVKAYNQEEYEKTKSFEAINQIKNYFIKSAFISNRLSPLMEFIGSLAIAVSIYAGGVFVLNESMTTGQFMSFLVSLLLAYQPVKALGNLNISIQEGLAGAERIFNLLDSEDYLVEIDKNKSNHLKIKKGKIKIQNLSFAYDKKNILENLNISIPDGKKIAIVGLSGSGKSTIISLLLRFFDDYNGKILIDDQDISKHSLYSLRKNIGLVTQDTMMFNDTIEANIKYGDLNASSSDINKAADESGVNEFANSLPDKLNTIVGESGIKLSGGQRQRIAIARAMLKNAPILLLDEATSALDNITEKKIQISIANLMKNRTSLVIAHRLSTVEDADLIYVLDKGKVLDFGRHEELLKKCNLYSQLHLHEELVREQ